MSGHYSYPLNDERELRFDKLMSELEVATKADVLDAATIHLLESIQRHKEYSGNPEVAKEFRTSVIRPKYRSWVDVNRP